jgi:hypothetical protein
MPRPTHIARTLVAAAGISSVSFLADAATLTEVMSSRYMKYNFCMQAALGEGWRVKHTVPFGMNKWGISEPTEAGIVAAPDSIRKRDALCRHDNEIDGQPRPRYEYPEKNKPD